MSQISEIQQQCYENAVAHGWWDNPRSFGDQAILYVTEITEAVEEWRNGHELAEIYYGPDGKPEGVPVELADCLIRILDTCQQAGIDLEAALKAKMAYNLTRPYRHGGKRL